MSAVLKLVQTVLCFFPVWVSILLLCMYGVAHLLTFALVDDRLETPVYQQATRLFFALVWLAVIGAWAVRAVSQRKGLPRLPVLFRAPTAEEAQFRTDLRRARAALQGQPGLRWVLILGPQRVGPTGASAIPPLLEGGGPATAPVVPARSPREAPPPTRWIRKGRTVCLELEGPELESRETWLSFLRAWRSEGGPPLDAVVLQLDVASIAFASASDIQRGAQRLTAMLESAAEELGTIVSLQVVLVAADSLPGFNEMFGPLEAREANRAWGHKFNASQRSGDVFGAVRSAFDELVRAVERWSAGPLGQLGPNPGSRLDTTLLFAAQLDHLGPKVAQLLECVRPGVSELAGLWMTGWVPSPNASLQRITPDVLERIWGPGTPGAPQARASERPEPRFVAGLFTEVLGTLVKGASQAPRELARLRRLESRVLTASLVGVALGALALLGVGIDNMLFRSSVTGFLSSTLEPAIVDRSATGKLTGALCGLAAASGGSWRPERSTLTKCATQSGNPWHPPQRVWLLPVRSPMRSGARALIRDQVIERVLIPIQRSLEERVDALVTDPRSIDPVQLPGWTREAKSIITLVDQWGSARLDCENGAADTREKEVALALAKWASERFALDEEVVGWLLDRTLTDPAERCDDIYSLAPDVSLLRSKLPPDSSSIAVAQKILDAIAVPLQAPPIRSSLVTTKAGPTDYGTASCLAYIRQLDALCSKEPTCLGSSNEIGVPRSLGCASMRKDLANAAKSSLNAPSAVVPWEALHTIDPDLISGDARNAAVKQHLPNVYRQRHEQAWLEWLRDDVQVADPRQREFGTSPQDAARTVRAVYDLGGDLDTLLLYWGTGEGKPAPTPPAGEPPTLCDQVLRPIAFASAMAQPQRSEPEAKALNSLRESMLALAKTLEQQPAGDDPFGNSALFFETYKGRGELVAAFQQHENMLISLRSGSDAPSALADFLDALDRALFELVWVAVSTEFRVTFEEQWEEKVVQAFRPLEDSYPFRPSSSTVADPKKMVEIFGCGKAVDQLVRKIPEPISTARPLPPALQNLVSSSLRPTSDLAPWLLHPQDACKAVDASTGALSFKVQRLTSTNVSSLMWNTNTVQLGRLDPTLLQNQVADQVTVQLLPQMQRSAPQVCQKVGGPLLKVIGDNLDANGNVIRFQGPCAVELAVSDVDKGPIALYQALTEIAKRDLAKGKPLLDGP